LIEFAQDWLPPEALTDETVRSAFADVVNLWSEEWFGEIGLALYEFEAGEAKESLSIIDIDRVGAALYLGALALKIEKDDILLKSVEAHIVDELGEMIIEEFRSALIKLIIDHDVEASAASTPGVRVEFSLADSKGVARLRGTAAAASIARFRKLRLASPCTMANLFSARNAVGCELIEIQALLGCSEISIAALMGIAVGDVLILDTKSDEPIRLTGSKPAVVFGKARWHPDEATLSLVEFSETL
jgi:hypothetical protein